MHFVTTIVDANAVFDRYFETGEIALAQEAVVLFVECMRSVGDRAAIEEIVYRTQFFVAIAARSALGFDHAGDAAAQISLFEQLAIFRRLAARQKYRRTRGK